MKKFVLIFVSGMCMSCNSNNNESNPQTYPNGKIIKFKLASDTEHIGDAELKVINTSKGIWMLNGNEIGKVKIEEGPNQISLESFGINEPNFLSGLIYPKISKSPAVGETYTITRKRAGITEPEIKQLLKVEKQIDTTINDKHYTNAWIISGHSTVKNKQFFGRYIYHPDYGFIHFWETGHSGTPVILSLQ